jgi:hypothetical protein
MSKFGNLCPVDIPISHVRTDRRTHLPSIGFFVEIAPLLIATDLDAMHTEHPYEQIKYAHMNKN